MHKPVIGAALLCATVIASAHAESERAAAPAFKVVKVARNDVLNIRSGPSAEHSVVGGLEPGSRGITITGDCKASWCPVQHQAVTGWVNRTFLANEDAMQVPFRTAAIPDAAAPLPAPGSQLGKDIEGPAEAAFVFFLAQGWSEHQAAGIVGNLQAECGQILNCSNGSGGIAQWRADRVTRFSHVFGYAFAKATFKDQLAYIQWELTHPDSPWKDSGRILKEAKDSASAASLFDIHYERSSGGSRSARISNARTILRKYGGRTAS